MGDNIHLGGVNLSCDGEVLIRKGFVGFLRTCSKIVDYFAEGVIICVSRCHITDEICRDSISCLDRPFDIDADIFGGILAFNNYFLNIT